ncbi:AaceriAER017Cp [[Ashbya] aceris (nom. inval.)]|nr:AaceriAER017Cp [[Ashbya] aceris (nom. inval.)]
MLPKTNNKFLSRRRIRVLLVTGVLLVLTYFIVQNATNDQFGSSPIAPRPVPNAPSVQDTMEAGDQNIQLSSKGAEGTVASPEKDADDAHVRQPAPVQFDPAKVYTQILSMSPMVVFSKSSCPYSLRLKELLAKNYEFSPEYYVVELDKHKNGAELQKYIAKTTGRSTVPNLVLNGVTRGGCDTIVDLHKTGELLQSLRKWADGKITVTQKQRPSNS